MNIRSLFLNTCFTPTHNYTFKLKSHTEMKCDIRTRVTINYEVIINKKESCQLINNGFMKLHVYITG